MKFNIHGTQTGRMSSNNPTMSEVERNDMNVSDLARELRTLVDIDGVTYRKSERTGMVYHIDTHERISDVLDSVFQMRHRVGIIYYDPSTCLLCDNFDLGIVGQDGKSGRAMLFATSASKGQFLNTAMIAGITNSTKPWTFRVGLSFISHERMMQVRNSALRKKYGPSVI